MSMIKNFMDERVRSKDLFDFGVQSVIFSPADITDSCNEVRSPDVFDNGDGTVTILYVPRTDNNPIGVYYGTANKNDLFNWTDQGKIINETGKRYYSATHIKVGSTWYVMCDWSDAGQFDLYTGSSLTTLSLHSSSPVLTGQGTIWETYLRHPNLIHDGVKFYCFYDGRVTAPKGWDGGVGFAYSDDCVDWTRWANNPLSIHDTYWFHNYQHAPTITRVKDWWFLYFGDTYYIPPDDGGPLWLNSGTSLHKTKDLNEFIWVTDTSKHPPAAPGGSQREVFYNDFDSKIYCFGTSGTLEIIGQSTIVV